MAQLAAGAGPARGADVPLPHASRALVAIVLGNLGVPIGMASTVLALPAIGQEFGVSLAATAWLVTVFLIVLVAAQPLGGRLGDWLGHPRLFLLGLGALGAGSLVGGLAGSFLLLLAGRVVQALGGALILTAGQALVRLFVPSARRGRAYGLPNGVTYGGAAIGPALGGVLISAWGWRATFLVLVPLVALALGLSLGVGATRRPGRLPRRPAIDRWGGLLLVGMAAVLVALPEAIRAGAPLAVAGWAVAGVGLGGGLVRQARRHPAPAVAWPLLRQRGFAAATAAAGVLSATTFGVFLLLPLFLQTAQGVAANEAGLVVMAYPLGLAAAAPLAGVLADRRGRRLPALVGSGLATGGVALLLPLGVDTARPYLMGASTVIGLGVGLASPALLTAAMEACSLEQVGAASGLFATVRYLVMIVCTPVIVGMNVAEGLG